MRNTVLYPFLLVAIVICWSHLVLQTPPNQLLSGHPVLICYRQAPCVWTSALCFHAPKRKYCLVPLSRLEATLDWKPKWWRWNSHRISWTSHMTWEFFTNHAREKKALASAGTQKLFFLSWPKKFIQHQPKSHDKNENLEPFLIKQNPPLFICGHLSKPSPGMEKLHGFAIESPAIQNAGNDPIGWFIVAQPSWSQHATHFLEDLQRFGQVIHRDGICNHIKPEIVGTFFLQHQKKMSVRFFSWLFLFIKQFLGGSHLETIEFPWKIGKSNRTVCFPNLDIKPWTIIMNLWIFLSILGVSTLDHLIQAAFHVTSYHKSLTGNPAPAFPPERKKQISADRLQ